MKITNDVTNFKALIIDKNELNHIKFKIGNAKIDNLKKGEVIIKVAYSGLNYKDILMLSGNPGLVRKYPHIPGIDASGTIYRSNSKKFKVVPDIYVFAKSIGNGYPIAAITGRSEIMNGFNSSFVSSTNWSEAIGLGAARSVLKKFQKSSPHEKIIELGECWANTIQKECESNNFMIDITGLPGMKYFSHPTDSDLFRTFFTVFALQENILVAGRYYPNTSQTIQDIKQYGELLNNAIVKYQSMSRSDIEKFTGKVVPGGFNSLEKILE